MEIIKLNLIPNGVNPVCHCSQYDKGRVIRAELFDGLTPYSLASGDVVTLNVRKPDNTVVTGTITTTQGNNYVDITTTEQICACVGNALCDLKIKNGSTVIGTLNFIIQVERDVLADGIPSQSVIEDLDAQVSDAVAESITDEINFVERGLKTLSPYNFITNWEFGAINVSNGVVVLPAASNRLRSRWINFELAKKIYKIICNTDYEAMLYIYDSDENYIGVLNTDTTTSRGARWKNTTNVNGLKGFDFSNFKVRIVFRKTDDSDLTLNDFDKISILGFMEIDPYTIRNFAIMSDSISNSGYIFFDTIGAERLEWGSINNSGVNADTPYYNTSKRINGYIPINSKATHINSFVKLIDLSFNTYVYICFYDANFGFIERQGGQKKYNLIAEIPENAKYYRVAFTQITTGQTDNISEIYVSQGIINNSGNSPINKFYVFGDSISAGYFSITDEEAAEKGYNISYRPSNYGYPVYNVGSVYMPDLSHNYWGYANKWFLHRDLIGKAYPGQGYFKIASNNKNGIMEIQQADVSDAGLIVVAWGFNDWHYNQPRGDHNLIDANVPYPVENYDITQLTTINQAIWYCLGELIRKAPQAKIVVQTPFNGWLYGGDFASNWGIGYTMTQSGTLANIHDDVKYWADYYGLQVLDMTYNNSVINRRNIKDVLIDGSHPSDPAHKQLARDVAIGLRYC